MFEVNVVIAEVGREVNTEANAHDEVDQGDAIQDNIPDSHEAKATYKMSSLGKPSFKKKKKNCNKCYNPVWRGAPPNVTEKIMYFFSETRPLLGHFLKKSVFCPLEMSNTWQIAEKWLIIGIPHFFYPKLFLPKWLRIA